ncbi:MAG: hypothetical protein ACXVCP_09610 [Bdellovibrio sp.]
MNRRRIPGKLLSFILLLGVWNPLSVQAVEHHSTKIQIEPAKLSGGSDSGGGNGIACFKNEAIANKAVNSEGVLNLDFANELNLLQVLDYWEADPKINFFLPRNNENPYSFLERIFAEEWASIAPEFSKRILDTLKRYQAQDISQTRATSKPHLINDIGTLMKTVPAKCKLIGMVNRYYKRNKNAFPELYIVDDQKIFKMVTSMNGEIIGVLNRSILILHEVLYILGVELGYNSSVTTRGVTRFLLSSNFKNSLIAGQNISFEFKRTVGVLGFDNYPLLFQQKSDQKQIFGSQYSQATRQNSYKKFIEKMRQATLAALGLDGSESEETKNEIAMKVMNDLEKYQKFSFEMNKNLIPKLSDEEAFLFLSLNAANRGLILSSDIFIASGATVELDDVRKVCGLVAALHEIDAPAKDLLSQKVDRYCSSLGVN